MTIPIKSKIQNRNLVVGCTNHCPYCYARINCSRFHMTEDFSVPQFFEEKLRLLNRRQPGNYLLTGMSDFADWQPEWTKRIFARIAENPQSNFLLLTKSPERISFHTKLPNVWIGVSVTSSADQYRIESLRQNIHCAHYFITFEPLHGALAGLDVTGIEWIVIGTETGKRKGKIAAQPDWVWEIVKQAKASQIPVFMKEELAGVLGEDAMLQQLPAELLHLTGKETKHEG